MPIEDRLRCGLEGNASAFVPEGERRLEHVHRRHRTRVATGAAAAAVVVALTVGAGGSLLWGSGLGGAPGPAQRPSPVATSATGYDGPRIPDSGWRKVVTRAQLARAGADRQFLTANVRRSGRLPTTLTFVGTVFSQSGRFPGGWSVGDAGTFTYDPEGRLALTSTSPGCRDCRSTFAWQLDGDRLVLSDYRGTPYDPVTAALFEGAWTRIPG